MFSESQLKYLRGLCHTLKPVIMTGNQGLSEAVHQELEIALKHHELIKVKLRTDDRDERKSWIETIQKKHQAQLIQKIGHVASFYRRNPKNQKIVIPN